MKPKFYVPQCLNNFQGFFVQDIKEWSSERRVEVHLAHRPEESRFCRRCGCELGEYHDQYKMKAKHLKMMGWQVEVVFFREKRKCSSCKAVRSEHIEWLCPASPHVTMELAWWLNRLTEETSVLATDRLESIGKTTCYKVDKYILRRLLQGYKIPKITRIAVDEVYARGPKQQKEHETRDDLFLTVVIDLKTKKVIWVSQSRKKEALDLFFEVIGKEACKGIQVVATDQHEGYGASIQENCKHATHVWDRFHLVQRFNEALNEDRKDELERSMPKGYSESYLKGKFRFIYLTKANERTKAQQRHIDEISRDNLKIAKMEIIKEHFHRMFEERDKQMAQVMMNEIYQWSQDCGAQNIFNWIKKIRNKKRFWNYWDFRVTTSISEGINRVIKGLKWQAFGYRDMHYFALKIMQKCGYLNSKYHDCVLPAI